jgi:hypothetical protein
MISKLFSIACSLAESKKIEISSFQDRRLRDIEKKLDNGEVDLLEAMNKLREEFKYNFSSEDYRKIEKEIGYNAK